jgi:hypothetical protein
VHARNASHFLINGNQAGGPRRTCDAISEPANDVRSL